MPYGQEIIQNQDLAQAMANQQMLQQRQQASQGLMQTNGSAGWAGILGAALGGYMNKKKGDQLAQGDADISRQIQAIQEAEKQRLEQVAQEKERAKIEREDMIRAEKANQARETMLAQQGFTASQNELSRNDTNNRFAQTFGMNQKQFDADQDFRNAQLASKQSTGKGLFTPEEQALIARNPQIEQQIIQEKTNKATGAQSTQETAGERKKREANEKLKNSMKNLYSLVKEHGTEYGGQKGAKMETAYGDFFMKYKTAEDLGAIQGADERLVKNIIADPTSFGAQFNPLKGGNITAQMEEYAKLQGWDFTKDDKPIQTQAPTIQGQQLKPQDMQLTNDLLKFYGVR